MSKKASMDQVLAYMGITYASLNRLMRAHPKPEILENNSLRGHPFPAAEKIGRELAFDILKVRQWCDDNPEFYKGRKTTKAVIEFPKSSLKKLLKEYDPDLYNEEKFDENLDKIDISDRDPFFAFKIIEYKKNTLVLEFDDPGEAVWFKLKYT